MKNDDLIKLANAAMQIAYAPYSNYKVGAALLTKSGKIYTGCNIENSAYTPTNCAERTAFFKAISEGERSFEKIAVVGENIGNVDCNITPCGVCRQVMREFCDDDFIVILATSEKDYKEYTLIELLPYSFSSGNLGGQ